MRLEPAQADPGDWEARLRRPALDVERKRRAWREALDDRDRLVLEGYDSHKRVRDIAAIGLMDQGRVCQIVAQWSTAEAGVPRNNPRPGAKSGGKTTPGHGSRSVPA